MRKENSKGGLASSCHEKQSRGKGRDWKLGDLGFVLALLVPKAQANFIPLTSGLSSVQLITGWKLSLKGGPQACLPGS